MFYEYGAIADDDDYMAYLDFAASETTNVLTYDEYVKHCGEYQAYKVTTGDPVTTYNEWLIYFDVEDYGFITTDIHTDTTTSTDIPLCLQDLEEVCTFDYLGATFTIYVDDNG